MNLRIRRAFTLIELLVVISIIALLVSLLLPALSGARESAKQLTCMSRIRTQGQALVMYQTDHSEYYPFGVDVRTGTTPKQQGGWRFVHQPLATYMGLQDTDKATRDANYAQLHCPVIWEEWTSRVGPDDADVGMGMFAWNPLMMGYVSASGYHSSGNFGLYTSGFQNVKEPDITSRLGDAGGTPASTVVFADGFNMMGATPLVDCQMKVTNQQVFSASHGEYEVHRNYDSGAQVTNLTVTGGRSNVCFMDGHVRSTLPKEFPGGTGLASWQVDP